MPADGSISEDGMKFRPNSNDGCYVSGRDACLSCKRPAFFPATTVRAVAISKDIDYWLIPVLACDIDHKLSFLSASLPGFGSNLAEAVSSQPAGKAMSPQEGRMLSQFTQIHFQALAVRKSGIGLPASVPAGDIADGGFAAEGVHRLSC